MLADTGPVAVLEAWVTSHPRYAYTVDATERNAAGAETTATLRITVNAEKKTEDVHVVNGAGAGSDMHLPDGETVDVRGPGFAHVLVMHLNVRDARILSPRKNDIRTGLFDRVARCFADDAPHVRSARTASNETLLTLSDEHGIACGPEYGDGPIATDRITLDANDGHPLVRERLMGSTVVERWVIRDVRVPS